MSPSRRWPALALAALLWMAGLPLLQSMAGAVEASADLRPLADLGEKEVAGARLLGCFRTILVDFLTVRAQAHLDEGEVYELVTLYETITRMVPRLEAGWFYHAYNLAYNLPEEVDDPDTRWEYVKRGVLLCREGEEWVPGSWLLPTTEGAIFLSRIGDSASHRERLAADADLNPDGLTASELSWQAGWRAIDRAGHAPLADHLVHVASRRMIEDGSAGERGPELARRLLEHLEGHEERLPKLIGPWRDYLESGGW